MKRLWIVATLVCLFIGIAGADWLDGGSDNSEVGSWFSDPGPDHGEIGSWFSDPIFSSGPTYSIPPGFDEQYYPYFGEEFFKSPVQPIRLGGLRNNLAASGLASVYPTRPTQSEFRNRSLAGMVWPSFKNNWSSTLDLAGKGSSFRVLRDRRWTNMR